MQITYSGAVTLSGIYDSSSLTWNSICFNGVIAREVPPGGEEKKSLIIKDSFLSVVATGLEPVTPSM